MASERDKPRKRVERPLSSARIAGKRDTTPDRPKSDRPKPRPKTEAKPIRVAAAGTPTSSNPAVLHRAGGAIKPTSPSKPGVTAPKPRPPAEVAEMRPKPRPKTEPAPKPRPAAKVAGNAMRAAALGGALTGVKSAKALETSGRPKPRPGAEAAPAGPMAKLAALMRGNKGHNESLALRRQRKAMRKG